MSGHESALPFVRKPGGTRHVLVLRPDRAQGEPGTAALLLQLAVSRQREFLADQTAAEILGEGRPLVDALDTLGRGVEALPMAVNPATASLYIANPLGGRGGRGIAGLFSTHPPIPARIAKLRAYDARRGIHY